MSDSPLLTRYENELNRFPATYKEALAHNVDDLATALSEVGGRELITIGSGGSYTTALFLADVHERVTGRLARVITPLEFISKPHLADHKTVFLVSAEGKNPDILESLYACRLANGVAINAITNMEACPLAEQVSAAGGTVFAFPLSGGKDGYLATNTLLADVILIARAYRTIDASLIADLPTTLGECIIGESSFDEWSGHQPHRFASSLKSPTVSVIYDPELKAAAVDFESKLIEAGITNIHIADFRNFAHGRHFWLARKHESTAAIGLVGDRCTDLWQSLSGALPDHINLFGLKVPGPYPRNTIAAIAAVMHFVKVAGQEHRIDPGKPEVPAFGRTIYHTPIHELVKPYYAGRRTSTAIRLKQDVLGIPLAAPPSAVLVRAYDRFIERVSRQKFRALVFDYDGTLCDTSKRFDPPRSELVSELSRLASVGVLVAIASGRGKSLHDQLRDCVAKNLWDRFVLGLYNGGHIVTLSTAYQEPAETNDVVLATAKRIVDELKELGVPIARVSVKPHQVSLTPSHGLDTNNLWFIIRDAFQRSGAPLPPIVRSAHSIDILGSNVSKLSVVDHVIVSYGVPKDSILSIGDQGAWPGNDHELLNLPNSLSVDIPSRHIDSGWKLAPANLCSVEAVLWYLHRMTPMDGSFTIDFQLINKNHERYLR